MPVGGFVRVLRAAVFAAVCVVLAALGHVVMSGEGLPWWVLLSGASVAGAVGWAFGARERRRRTVAGLTVAAQTGLHAAFTLAQSGDRPVAAPETTQSLRQWADHFLCGAPPTPTQAARAYDIAVAAGLHPADHVTAHGAHGVASAGHDMPPMGGMHDMTQMAGTSSWGMLAAHVLAAVLCGIWLAQGESAAFKLVRACADRAFVPLRLVLAVLCPPPAPPSFRPAPRSRGRLRQLLLVHILATRGPPGETAVV
ncbi:hypothetical protein DMH12_15670 [Streptomyces sp. WAC 04229]|uniref:hypothetical protein n=1 Tax=Streptomyces sp. WAC 04229 TaxID=2203206 RepID=UPI000F73F4CC|nr:hypothetical protein [Streptomyces sp. WAC 04229]RSN54980.1 hypothetical protein DMH12_15670 [Streptomyces sp. WAC 04229]